MISPYPWHALRRVTRETLSAQRAARRRIFRIVELERLAAAAAEVLQMDVSFTPRDPPALGAESTTWSRLRFQSVEGDALFSLSPSPALANALLSRILDRPVALGLAERPLDPVLLGALTALVVEIARRTGAAAPLRGTMSSTEPETELSLEVTVALDGRPYELLVAVNGAGQATRPDAALELRSLGELPIRLPVVVALATLERAELAALEPGDAFVPGPALTLEGAKRGAAVLAGAVSEHGVAVTLTEQGGLVLRGERVGLGVDGGSHMTDSEQTGDAVNRTALEAPVVVRVELGSVTLLAREWAELRPGDVIETGRRVAEPVVLRVAGQEVARGELVNVDGELGVRIQTLVSGSSS
ncbi:MAG TPA: FliM/FliN family flagellar motor switch protein [Polyangiaceae bacterium]